MVSFQLLLECHHNVCSACGAPIGNTASAIDPHANTGDLFKQLLAVPSLSQTKKLPGVVLFHQGMRMRLITTLQQPFAVQDAECTVVGFEPDPADHNINSKIRLSLCTEMK